MNSLSDHITRTQQMLEVTHHVIDNIYEELSDTEGNDHELYFSLLKELGRNMNMYNELRVQLIHLNKTRQLFEITSLN